MRCPACNFVSSNKRDSCPNCNFDLRPHKIALGLPVTPQSGAPSPKSPSTPPQAQKGVEKETAKASSLPEESTSNENKGGLTWVSKLLKKEPDKKVESNKESKLAPEPKVLLRPPQENPMVPVEPKNTLEKPLESPAEKVAENSKPQLPEKKPTAPDLDTPLPLSLNEFLSENLPNEEMSLAELARDVQGIPDVSPPPEAFRSGSPTPVVSPQVIEFNGDDEELFQKQLDELIGDVTFDIEAVKGEKKEGVPAQTESQNAEFAIDDELSVMFEVDVSEEDSSELLTPTSQLSSTPPSTSSVSENQLLHDLAAIVSEIYGIPTEQILAGNLPEKKQQDRLPQEVIEESAPLDLSLQPPADELIEVVEEPSFSIEPQIASAPLEEDDDLKGLLEEVTDVLDSISLTDEDIFRAVSLETAKYLDSGRSFDSNVEDEINPPHLEEDSLKKKL